MIKKLKNWKFVFFVSLIFIYLSLFSVLYSTKTELPSENWSKEIKITSYETQDFEISNNDIDLIKYNDRFLLAYYSDQQIIIEEFDNDFNPLNKYQLNKTIDNLVTLKLFENSNNFFVRYTTDDNNLFEITTDVEGIIKNEKKLVENFKMISYDKDNYIYSKDSRLYMNDYSMPIIEQEKIQQLDHQVINGDLIIGYTYFDSQKYKYSVNSMIVENNNLINQNNIDSFVLANNAIPIDFDIGFNENNYFLMTVFKNQKAGVNDIRGYRLNQSLELEDNFSLDSSVYNTNVKIVNNSDFDYIINNKISLGRIDISTKNNVFENLSKYNGKNKIKDLTQNQSYDNKSQYYKIDGLEYLLFGKRSDGINELYISSNANHLIKKSQELNFDDIKSLLFTTITTFLPLFYLGLIPGIGFLLPVIIILVPVSLIKINWAEHNPKKIMLLSFIIYLSSKIYFVINNLSFTNLPFYYSNLFIRLVITLIFTLIALYCLYDYTKGKKFHFIKQMAFFYVIDVIMFILLFTPYYII